MDVQCNKWIDVVGNLDNLSLSSSQRKVNEILTATNVTMKSAILIIHITLPEGSVFAAMTYIVRFMHLKYKMPRIKR